MGTTLDPGTPGFGTDEGAERSRPLSDRELEVLALIASGLSDKTIGTRLHLSQWTIKHHAARVMDFLQAKNRAHAVGLAYQRGILSP